MSGSDTPLHELGWRIEIDAAERELYLEHAETDTTYVLDADGGLRLAGESDIKEGLDALRETLAAVDDGDAETGAEQTALTDGGSATDCTLECDETTGEVTIESDTRITLDAPAIEMASQGNISLQASGVLTLEGALIKLN
mgnify:CR=1 FL=1